MAQFRAFIASIAVVIATTCGALAENRIALVIGNSSYRSVTVLPNPANDARAMTNLLNAARFEVISAPDLGQTDMRQTLRAFAAKVTEKGPDTAALIYYAGHGLQVEGENYLVPIDARIERESDVAIEAVRLTDVMSVLASTPSRTRIVILDACRNNPFSSINQVTGTGLAIVDAPTGSIVSYSTAPGSTALDGSGANSPFTAALIEVAKEPNLPIEQAFKRVRLNVHKTTDGAQTPWESSSLTSDFAFFGAPVVSAATGTDPKTPLQVAVVGTGKPPGFWRKELQSRPAQEAYEIVIREDSVDAYEDFLALYPLPPFAPRVRSLAERRREMMTWYTAMTVNTALAFQAFLERYPNSDLAPTAKRLLERAQPRAQSANLMRSLPGLNPPQNANQPPAATPVNLPVVPAAVCTCPPEKKTEKTEPKPTPKVKHAEPRVRVRPPTDQDIFGTPPPNLGPTISIGIGGSFGRRRSSPHPSSSGTNKPH
ncbi:MAG: caspase family protein [Rhizobiales bacterium]|nr:caspase family protein [Hyphomicrobiales bacterium]